MPDLNRAVIALARAHRARAAVLLAEVGVHPGQEVLLMHLWAHGSSTPTALAAALGVEPPTVTKMLARMQATGLLERTADPLDGRVTRVAPSAAAEVLRPELVDRWERLGRETCACMSADERDHLLELLVRATSSLRARAGGGDEPPHDLLSGGPGR